MKKMKGTIAFIITVTVLSAVALLPFVGISHLSPVFSTSAPSKENSEAVSYDSSEQSFSENFTKEEPSDDFCDKAENNAASSEEKHSEEGLTEKTPSYIPDSSVSENQPTEENSSEYIADDTAESISGNTDENTAEATTEALERPECSTTDSLEPEILPVEELLKEEALVMPMLLSESYLPETAIEVTKPLQLLSPNIGSLLSAESVNTYEFTLEKRSVFSFSFAHGELDGAKGWRISVYGEYFLNGVDGEKGYRLLHIHNSKTAGGTEKSLELGLDAGNYRLSVSKGAAFTDKEYQIDAVIDNRADFEIECNDNIFRYTELYNSIEVSGSASMFDNKQDQDFYMFRMPEDGYIDFSFVHPTVKDKASVCWQVVLFAENGTEIISFNSLFSDSAKKTERAGLAAGNYYVLIKNVVYTDITYTLEIERSYSDLFETEPNGTEAGADIIGLNSSVSGILNSRIGGLDRDHYKIIVKKTGSIKIDFSHPSIEEGNTKNGWNIVLMNEKGERLFTGRSLWGNESVGSPEIGLGGGTYYILIDSESFYHNTAQYKLSVTYTESDSWESESNNSFSKADMITADIPVNGLIADCGTDYDFDYYTFDITEKTDIEITFSHAVLDYSRYIFEFSLYDANESGIIPTDGDKPQVSISSDEEITKVVYKELPKGKYYIKVSPGLFYDNTKYTLLFTKGVTQ